MYIVKQSAQGLAAPRLPSSEPLELWTWSLLVPAPPSVPLSAPPRPECSLSGSGTCDCRYACTGPKVQPVTTMLSAGSQPSWPVLRHLGREGVEAQRSGLKWLKSPTSAHSEVKLSVVTYLTNSIVDEILQELYHSHKSLVKTS